MSLQLNAAKARDADKMSNMIRETGKYVGTITRAEKLLSTQGTKGVGFSFKTKDGQVASYLDVYTHKANGDELWGAAIVQSILCCTRVKNADEGQITFERWSKEDKAMVECTATGYPSLMGKPIGLILQVELQSHYQTGADTERMNIVRVFEAASGLTASEILDGKTKAEKVDAFMKGLAPFRDNRKKQEPLKTMAEQNGTKSDATFDDDIPF
jgi:hypothetical protein